MEKSRVSLLVFLWTNWRGIRSLVPHLIGPPSHWSPSHWSPNSLVPQYILGAHWSPISLVPHITGPPSHWSPFSFVTPSSANPNGPPSHWSPISLVPLLRIAAEMLTPSVTRILNHSLISGVVPQDWKIARVTPVYKRKGDKNDRSNYRPISVLGSISMIMEREVHSQILSYFIKHDLITIDQFAFLKNHSTTGCLHRIIDGWYEALNEGEFVMACFFDIKKCFDSINHAILLRKLALYGIRGPELQCFQNYSSGRRQSLSCNGTNSGICNISTGVPQSSTLGPFLFLIFINDLPQHIRTGSSNIFAGDSAIYTTGKSFMETKATQVTRATLNAEIPLGRLDQYITPNSKHIGVIAPHPINVREYPPPTSSPILNNM